MVAINSVIIVLTSAALATAGQNVPPPSQPNVVAPPTWSRAIQMPDGRTFVTDGGLSLDSAIAKPASLPATVLPAQNGAVIARYLSAPYDHEVALNDLGAGSPKNTFIAPGGIVLNGNYVNFLRRVMPAARVKLRVKGDFDPVVVMFDGKAVGVLMPVRR